ncbi:MAG: hypothetical protein ACXWTR_00415 [Methylotenera sp.]
MKCLALVALVLAHISFANVAIADEISSNQPEIPTSEIDFVRAVNGLDKARIIEQFGEPAKADDVKIKGSDQVVASIWQYHFINTSADGAYYETTELDFIDDKVVSVVFMNNDGSESADSDQKYEIPTAKPDL